MANSYNKTSHWHVMELHNNTFDLFNERIDNETDLFSPLQREENHTVYAVYEPIFFILLCAFLIISNSLLLHTILSNRKKVWTKQTKHIVYLIVCDLIVGTLLIPNIMLTLLDVSQKGYWFCAPVMFTSVSSQLVSYYHMLAVCIHRYRRVRKIDIPSGNDRYMYGLESIIIWATVFLASVPPFLSGGERST